MVRSYISFFSGACLSKISVQIVENASSLFSSRNCPCILKSGSHLPPYLLQGKPFKNDEKCFLIDLKSSFVLKIFNVLCWIFDNLGIMAWLERWG